MGLLVSHRATEAPVAGDSSREEPQDQSALPRKPDTCAVTPTSPTPPGRDPGSGPAAGGGRARVRRWYAVGCFESGFVTAAQLLENVVFCLLGCEEMQRSSVPAACGWPSL